MNDPRDRILLQGLRAVCIIGDEAWERTQPQGIRVDLEFICDLTRAGATDALHDTVDYAAVAQSVMAYIRDSRFHLIEALACGIAHHCLTHFPAQAITVTLRKPSHIDGVASCGVRITRPLASPG